MWGNSFWSIFFFHFCPRKVPLKLEWKLWRFCAVHIVAEVNRVMPWRKCAQSLQNKKINIKASLLTCQTASLFLTKRKTHRAHVTPALSTASLIAKRENTCQIKSTELPRKSNTHVSPTYTRSHGDTRAYVSLQPLISLAAGPSFRITLLSSQPRGAKLFKYPNSSRLPLTRPLSFQHSATHNLSFHCCQFRGNPSH